MTVTFKAAVEDAGAALETLGGRHPCDALRRGARARPSGPGHEPNLLLVGRRMAGPRVAELVRTASRERVRRRNHRAQMR